VFCFWFFFFFAILQVIYPAYLFDKNPHR
jgi:hypothetical protein